MWLECRSCQQLKDDITKTPDSTKRDVFCKTKINTCVMQHIELNNKPFTSQRRGDTQE